MDTETEPDFEPDAKSTFTHDELLKITSSVLSELLSKDSFLSDLPSDVTIDEINNEIAVLHGKSITVHVMQEDTILPVIVPQTGCRVMDLKRAVRRCITLKLARIHGRQKLSWRYVWRTYNLKYNEVYLDDDNMLLQDAGVHHKSKIYFVKKRRKKNVFM